MTQLRETLENLKLSEKEVDLFLALVRLGKSTVSVLARESGITRTHIYGIVEVLVKKGLVSEV
ncbi:MAG: helix-turn-helix domain-containing protein, partial [Patescibacteria group bacterium]